MTERARGLTPVTINHLSGNFGGARAARWEPAECCELVPRVDGVTRDGQTAFSLIHTSFIFSFNLIINHLVVGGLFVMHWAGC